MDGDVLRLAEAVDAPDALLDLIGFQGRSKLTTVWQNWRLRPSPPASVESRICVPVAEFLDGRFLLGHRQVSMERGHREAGAAQILAQVLQRGAELREDDDLAPVTLQQFEQTVQLGAPSHGTGQIKEVVDLGPLGPV